MKIIRVSCKVRRFSTENTDLNSRKKCQLFILMFFERKSASSFPHRIPLKYNFSLAELILGSFCYYEMQNNSVELVDPSIAFKTTWSDFFVCWWYNSVPFLTHIYTDCLARGCLNGWKSRMVANSTFQKAPNNVKCKESMYTHQLWDYTNSVELNTQTHTHTQSSNRKQIGLIFEETADVKMNFGHKRLRRPFKTERKKMDRK